MIILCCYYVIYHTPLQSAIEFGQIEMLEFLLNHGADPRRGGGTINGNTDIDHFISNPDRHVDFSNYGVRTRTALDLARGTGNQEVINTIYTWCLEHEQELSQIMQNHVRKTCPPEILANQTPTPPSP